MIIREHCEANYGIEHFHKLVKQAEELFYESGIYAGRAAKEQKCVNIDLGRAIRLQVKAEHLAVKAYEWLQEYGQYYECKKDCPECEAILQAIIILIEQLNEVAETAKVLSEQLECALKEMAGMEVQLLELAEQYARCVHFVKPQFPPRHC